MTPSILVYGNMFSIVYYAYLVLHCSPQYYIYSTTTFFIPSDVLTPHLESSMFCRLHSPTPYHPLHITCSKVQGSYSFQNIVQQSVCPHFPSCTAKTTTDYYPRRPHIWKESPLTLHHISYCPTEVAAHTLQPTPPGLLLTVSSGRRYSEHTSSSPCIPRSVRSQCIFHCHCPSLRDVHIVDSTIPACHLPTAPYPWVTVPFLLLSSSSRQVLSSRRYPCPEPGIWSRYRSSNYLGKSLTVLKTPHAQFCTGRREPEKPTSRSASLRDHDFCFRRRRTNANRNDHMHTCSMHAVIESGDENHDNSQSPNTQNSPEI